LRISGAFLLSSRSVFGLDLAVCVWFVSQNGSRM
jgi:hypothetical protein